MIGGESLEGPLTGIGQYTYHLTREMLKRPEIEELKLLVHGRVREPTSLMCYGNINAQDNAHQAERPSRYSRTLGHLRSIVAQNKTAVALYARLMPPLERHSLRHYNRQDIYHSPNYMLPD
ncbi:MAG: hypothetical protein ACJA09_003748, partial [Alcanivorax sp.]